MHIHTQFAGVNVQTISATDLTRNTREILDQVATRGESVNVERNRTIVARIVPSTPTMTATQALQGLRRAPMSAEQAQAWLRDSRQDFDENVRDPWV